MSVISVLLLIVFLARLIIRAVSVSTRNVRYDSTPLPPRIRQNEKKEVVPGNPFYTNAPEHWGVITDGILAANQKAVTTFDEKTSDYVVSRRKWMVNSLVLMGNINEALQKKKGDKVPTSYSDGLLDSNERYATTCCVEKLFEKGIMSISGIAIDNFERYAVILCDGPTPIKYINELRQYFIEDGYIDLIYFAVDDPNTVTAVMPLKFGNFNKNCFSFFKAKQGPHNWKYDSYAMWWAGEKEPNFNQAVIKDDIRVYLDLLNFHNSYALGILSFGFGLKDNNSRTRLPNYDEVVVSGPEGVEIVISLSTEKGINFHFPMLPRFEKYRNKFIKVYINFCYDIRAQIVANDWPDDSFETVSTLPWYEQLLYGEAREAENMMTLEVLSKTIRLTDQSAS